MARLQTDMVHELVLGKFRLLRHLGDGGVGPVYLGRRENVRADDLSARVLVKLIPKLGSAELVEAVRSEVDRLRKIRHPAVAEIIEFGEEDRSHFLITEYVHGFSLKEWSAFVRDSRGAFPTEIAIQVVIDALHALHSAHTARGSGGQNLGITHRDLMPSNVMISVEGAIKLIDFGIARVVSEGTAVMDPSLLDKFAYLTPELVGNTKPGPPSDVYQMGLLLHVLLVGENPFAEGSLPATLSAVMTRQPSSVDSQRSDLPAGLGEVISKALEKKPADRFQTAVELAGALEKLRLGTAEEIRGKLADLVAQDFRSPAMASSVGAVSLEDREASLASAPKPEPGRKPRSSRPSTEERVRARFSAAGEVRGRPRRDQPVVWKSAPSVEPPRMSEPPRRKKSSNNSLATLGLLAVVVLGLALALVLMLR